MMFAAAVALASRHVGHGGPSAAVGWEGWKGSSLG